MSSSLIWIPIFAETCRLGLRTDVLETSTDSRPELN
jgi:hypothetical protein